MEKLKEKWYTLTKEEKERYKYLEMLDLNEKSLSKMEGKDTMMEEYEELVKKLNADSGFRMHITEEQDAQLIYNSDMELAEERGAKQKAIETAKKLLHKAFDVEEIVDLTGLSIEEVNSLKE